MTIQFDTEGSGDLHLEVLKILCGDTSGKSMIDLMCCHARTTGALGFDRRQYMDIQHWDLEQESQYFVQANVLDQDWEVSPHFDVSLCLDGIEHLTVPDGQRLIAIMQLISDKQILFTPLNNFFGMSGVHNSDPDEHRSLWTPEQFPDWITIVFPNFHKIWEGGAWYGMKSIGGMTEEFDRITQLLTQKSWAKFSR